MSDGTNKTTSPTKEGLQDGITKIREAVSLLSKDIGRAKLAGEKSQARIDLDDCMDRYAGLDVFLLESAEIEIARFKRGNSQNIKDTKAPKVKSDKVPETGGTGKSENPNVAEGSK